MEWEKGMNYLNTRRILFVNRLSASGRVRTVAMDLFE